MDSNALAERLRNARATASEDERFQKQRAADDEVRKQRREAAEKRADAVIAEVLAKLDDPEHQPGKEIEVMRTDGDDAGDIVFNRLMEAAQANGSSPCWYPLRDREVDMCDDHYGVIKLRYGICPDQPDPFR